MSLDSQRVPAWRRLGLALKNQDPASTASPSAPPPATPCDRRMSPVESTANSFSSTLGKRKNHADSHEDALYAAKKSKTGSAHDESLAAPASHSPTAPHTSDSTDVASVKSTAISGAARPKGDANYRKKKEKVPKRKREKATAQPVSASPSEAAPSTSLAPAGTAVVAPAAATVPPTPGPSKKDKGRHSYGSASPLQIDRRKSVAFTPDTKTSDGNSGQELFKKWVAEQKGTGQVSAPPAVSNFTLHSLIAAEEKTARHNGQLESKAGAQNPQTALETAGQKRISLQDELSAPSQSGPSSAPSTSATASKKKDPAVYIAYLTQYYIDRGHWKFNKAKQNDVVDNALSIFRIPHEHTEALSEYIAGLKGAGVIERLRERCKATLKELDEQDTKKPMDDIQARKIAEQEAEHERIIQEQKRRRTEGDVERLMHHPHGEGYIRRLQRKRAEALLTALSRAAPILPAVNQDSGINPLMKSIAPPQRDGRKRKRRTDVSSDESSSDSSSGSSSDGESSSDSDSDSDSGSGSGSDSDSDSNSDSDSDSNSDSQSDSDESQPGSSTGKGSSSGSDTSSSRSSDGSDNDTDSD